MSQDELARRSKVDKAIISKIENGKMNGTIACHTKIASAFGMKLSEFYAHLENDNREPAALHPANLKTDVYQDFLEILTVIPLAKRMLPVFITVKENQTQYLEETIKKVERFIIILEGEVEIEIEEKKYLLGKEDKNEKGDSLYSLSQGRHAIKNIGTATAKLLCVSVPPVL